MGKGGEKNIELKSEANFKLNSLPTEELRKWAFSYCVKSNDERIDLLEKLVIFQNNILKSYFVYLIKSFFNLLAGTIC